MIALINFTEDMVIERENALKLNLNFEEHERYGKSMSYGRQIQPMRDDNLYDDECFKEEIDGKITYYKDEAKTKEISEYYRYTRIADKDWVFVKKDKHLVDLESFALNCMYPYSIEKCIKSEEPTVSNLSSMINQIEEKFEFINKQLDIFKNQQFNQKVNVHVGGGLIVTYNELMLKEDSCTDILQGCLNDGWRIIAVCNQPDQRRPDYVLGRFNPNLDVISDATRAKR